MSRRIIGIVQTDRQHIALTAAGACPNTDIFLKKSADTPPTTASEESDMDKTVLKTVLSFDEATKAHYLSLDDATGDAFVAKSADERKKEVDAAKAAADKKATADAAAEAAKGAVSPEVAALTTQVEALKAQVANMEKAAGASTAEKLASHPDFIGFPGGTEELVKQLKAVTGADIEKSVSDSLVDGLKARAAVARGSTRSIGMVAANQTTSEIGKAQAAAKEVAKTKGISEDEALQEQFVTMSADRLNAALEEEDAHAYG